VFGIEWTEYAVIAIVALIVIGPKELPAVLRAIGQWTTKIRRMAAEFQGQFQEALREAEMADLKKEIDDAARGFNSQFDDPMNVKEATKWEPNPDPANPDHLKPDAAATPAESSSTIQAPQESASVAPASPPDPPSQAAEGKSVYAPLHASAGTEGEESFPIAAEHAAIEQTPAVPSAAGTGGSSGGNGGRAAEAAAAPHVAPPLAQPPFSEGSVQRGSEGGVHS
jgi:sec-independent protein translocase protein TatB